jgi:hypothetical protein
MNTRLKKENRIETIAAKFVGVPQALAYEKLDWLIGNDPEEALSADEIKSISFNLFIEKDLAVQKSLWVLALRVPANETIKDLCLNWLAETGNRCRGYAMHYLRVKCPELIPSIFKKYQDDTDPGVRYGLAKHLQRLNAGKAIEMMIGALLKATAEELDVLSDEIEITGDKNDLKRLRQLDEENGGGTSAGRVAVRLEARLRKNFK